MARKKALPPAPIPGRNMKMVISALLAGLVMTGGIAGTLAAIKGGRRPAVPPRYRPIKKIPAKKASGYIPGYLPPPGYIPHPPGYRPPAPPGYRPR